MEGLMPPGCKVNRTAADNHEDEMRSYLRLSCMNISEHWCEMEGVLA